MSTSGHPELDFFSFFQIPCPSGCGHDHHRLAVNPDGGRLPGQFLDLPNETGRPGMSSQRHQYQAQPFDVHLLLCFVCQILQQRLSQSRKNQQEKRMSYQ